MATSWKAGVGKVAVGEIRGVVIMVLPFLPILLPKNAATVKDNKGRNMIDKYVVRGSEI